jgi:magnesium-transporting ATPase (P-type)
MRRPPASLAQRLFSKSLLARIVFGGMLLVGSMETGFFLAGRAENEPQSVVFGALVLGHAALALSMRTREFALSGLWRRRNPLFLIWLGLALALVALAFNVSVLADALSTVRLTRRDWMLVFLMPAGLFALHETGKAAVRHARK